MDFLSIVGEIIVKYNFVALGCFLLILLYILGTINHDHFKKQGVLFVKPWPILGNMGQFLMGKKQLPLVIQDMYNKCSGKKVFGFFEFMRPVYVIRDPELIKKICIKDFDHFANHRGKFDEEHDSIFAKSLFAIYDQKWKNMRTIMSPAFTGSKMRQMFGLITDYCDKATETLLQNVEVVQELEMKNLFQKFGNDIVATCAFGLEVNSIKNPENDFFKEAQRMTKLDGWQGFKFMAYSSYPALMKKLRINIFHPRTVKFFRDIVSSTLRFRESNNILRHDMIDLLLQAKGKELKFETDTDRKYGDAGFATVEDYHVVGGDDKVIKWTNDDITAQCAVFLFGGFDPSSTLAAFVAYELAVNPDIQGKLQNEIDDVRKALNGEKLNYETIQHMKYLDMVVSETLRKWSPVTFLDRKCNKDYVIEENDGTKLYLKPGDGVWLPAYPIQRDPEYFPNPDKFDPERFSNENKLNVDPSTYLMFGIGPRNCIGSRFALMECKGIFFHILSKFNIEISPKTKIPFVLKYNSVPVSAEGGFWVNFRVRE